MAMDGRIVHSLCHKWDAPLTGLGMSRRVKTFIKVLQPVLECVAVASRVCNIQVSAQDSPST
jgi:hypothetical protein